MLPAHRVASTWVIT